MEPPRPIRVLFDMEAAAYYPGGLSCHALRLWNALRKRPDLEIQAIGALWRKRHVRGLPAITARFAPGADWRRVPWPRGAVDAFPWLAWPWTRGLCPDVAHTPANAVPPWLTASFGKAALVVTLHDLAWHPGAPGHFASAAYRRLIQKNMARALRHPRAIFCAVSRFTAGEAAEKLHIPPERIVVAPEGLHWEGEAPIPPEAVAAALNRRGLPMDGYVLAVGVLSPRKNYATLINAFDRLRAAFPEARLAVVGQPGWDDGPIRRLFAERGEAVRHIEKLPLDELRALYLGARLVCCPSLHEGFGLPALEAMASGRPLVYAAGTAMDEVAGDAGAAVPPLDGEAMAGAMINLWRRPDERAARGRMGLARARRFSWDACAAATAEAYRKAMGWAGDPAAGTV